MDTGVYPCWIGKKKKKTARSVNKKGAPMLIQQAWASTLCLWDMIYGIYMWVFVRRILLCVYWSVIVYSNRCWLCEMRPPLCSLEGFNPLRVAFCCFVLVFKPSFSSKCDSITVTCHFLFISTHDKAFTFSIPLHTWVFPTDLLCYWKINVNFIQ